MRARRAISLKPQQSGFSSAHPPRHMNLGFTEAGEGLPRQLHSRSSELCGDAAR